MSFNEPQWKSLSEVRADMDTAFLEGSEVLLNYNNYQTEVSNDIKGFEDKLRGHGVKTSFEHKCERGGSNVMEWKFYKPKNANQGRFRLCFNGNPLLEKPFEIRVYAHRHLPEFYRMMIVGLRAHMVLATDKGLVPSTTNEEE